MAALTAMRDAGFTVALDGDALRIKPVSKLTPEQRTYIRDHKVMLVEELQAEAANDAAPPVESPLKNMED